MTLVLSFFEPLHHDLITVRRLVQVSNLSLHVLQMFFQLLKGTEQSLSSLMEDVNPVMEITQETLEMFQFSKAFLVLFDQPTGTWMDQRCKWMKTGKYLKKVSLYYREESPRKNIFPSRFCNFRNGCRPAEASFVSI